MNKNILIKSIMDFPAFHLNYLIELGKLQKQFPNLEIVQLDGVLRTRTVLPASPPTQDQLIKMMPNATLTFETRTTTPTLNSAAPTFEPVAVKASTPTPPVAPVATPVASLPSAAPISMTAPSFRMPSGPRRGREPTTTNNNINNKSWASVVEEA